MASSSNPSGPETGPLAAGTVLQNRYKIERLLGGGGMGMVYLAHDQRLANRWCALKEMVDHFIDPQQRIEANDYFAREADTLAQLKHQAIPAITDRFDDQNRHYLVMEYVEGRNLEEELATRGEPLPESLVVDIARQLCDVLGYLHGLTPPIVYRDMKPSNVMLTPKGRVVLVDFGIARLFKAARKGTMIGTLGFAPPEQYQGQVDPRSDIYSLGATLHYVLTSRDPEKFPPFSFPPLRELRPAISSNLAGAIDAALAYEMDRRPANIQEFRDMMLYGRGLDADGLGVSPRSGTADLTFPAEVTELIVPHRPRSAARRAIGLLLFTIALGGAAFGATYVYSSPEMQIRLGIKSMVDNLPWKHEELLAKARQEPLKFSQLTLALSTREGIALGPPQAAFKDTDLTNARYLKWTATFDNSLAGLEGSKEKIEARFFDPNGLQIASSTSDAYIGPAQKTADFSAVALMPTMTDKPAGRYKVSLYQDDKRLAEEAFTVDQDVASRQKAADAVAAEAAAARAEEQRRLDEARRLAMLDERRRKPLSLRGIDFVNTTKTGTALSGPTNSFDVSKVLFVGWQVMFDNQLYKLEQGTYRVDAAYIAPDGRTLGSVNDFQNVSMSQRMVTFSGRVGNSHGGAFLPGTYTVNFYLNGQYIGEKKFRVQGDTSGAYASYGPSGSGGGISNGGSSGGSSGGGASLLGPTVASGHISGLPGGGSPELELRLRPQPNGFLHGEMQIHRSGFDTAPIEGFVRGDKIEFQVPYGTETYFFEGKLRSDQITGTFESAPSNERGNWTAQTN
ncbi:MAG TPA: protein kinase [Candidatus Binataceae bacterium]